MLIKIRYKDRTVYEHAERVDIEKSNDRVRVDGCSVYDDGLLYIELVESNDLIFRSDEYNAYDAIDVC